MKTIGDILNEQRIDRLKTSMRNLKERYFQYAVSVGMLIQKLPRTTINTAYSNQLIRSSSSPGTNYRAALRGKSTADFVNKLKIVEEELDESDYFLSLLLHFNMDFIEDFQKLIKETNELLAINVASIKKVRASLGTS